MHDRPLDPRQQRTRDNVLAATRTVLRRDGLRGATMEAVAAEAGVARSTLYRNWASLDELLDHAITDVVVPAPPTPDVEPLDRLRDAVERLAGHLDHSEWGGLLPSVVAAIDASPELADRYRAFVDGQRRTVRRMVRAAIAGGSLPPTVDPDDLIDDLVGALFYRRLVRRTPTSPAWARAHADRTIAAHASSAR